MTMTYEKLMQIKEKNRELVMVRRLVASKAEEMAKHTAYRKQILVCGGTGCTSSGSHKVADALESEIKEKGLTDVLIVKTGCFGLCALGPVVIVYPEGAFYSQTTPEGAKRIIDEHIIKGSICKDLLYPETVHEDGEILPLSQTNFYAKQMRIALRNCGVIDPENIEEYIALELPALEAAAARASRQAGNGLSVKLQSLISNMCAATPTKATRARSWTVPSLKAILTQSSKQWRSQVIRSARARVMSMSVLSIRSQSRDLRSLSSRPENTAFSARISSEPASILTSRSVSARARSSAVRRQLL